MSNKMPPEILAHFKGKKAGEDKISDKEKRKEALEKARQYQKNKKQK